MNGVFREIAGVLVKAAVEVGLAAAGLRGRKRHLHAQSPQQAHRGDAHIRKEGIPQAGDHQRNLHVSPIDHPSAPRGRGESCVLPIVATAVTIAIVAGPALEMTIMYRKYGMSI